MYFSIQSQLVNLLLKLQRERGITFLFIAHDLSMVKYISDRIAVMHFGKIVEMQDFAQGTSSRSTKLVHGGLRDLKQFQIGVVAETGK